MLFLLLLLVIGLIAIFTCCMFQNEKCCLAQSESEAASQQPRPTATGPRAPVQIATAYAPAAPVQTTVATALTEHEEIPAVHRSSMGRILKPVGQVSVARLESPSSYDVEADPGGEDSTPEQEMTQRSALTADFGDNLKYSSK